MFLVLLMKGIPCGFTQRQPHRLRGTEWRRRSDKRSKTMPAKLALSNAGEPASVIRKCLFWRCERFSCATWIRQHKDTLSSATRPERAWSVCAFPTVGAGIEGDSWNRSPGGEHVSAEGATERSLRANRARKSNNRPSHIDDWMYAKLAGVKPIVNEIRVKNTHSGGFLHEIPFSGAENACRRTRSRRLSGNRAALMLSARFSASG